MFFKKSHLFFKKSHLLIIIISSLVMLLIIAIGINYWFSYRRNMYVEAAGRADVGFRVFYMENDFFTENPIPLNLHFLMSFTDFIEVDSSFSARFSEEVQVHYNYTSIKRVVIRYMATVDGNLNPIVFEKVYDLSESEGTVTSSSMDFPRNTYVVFPRRYIDYYLDFVELQSLQMEAENIIARGMRGFSAELFIDFTYDIYVQEWDMRETVTQGYRISLSSEVYSFVVTGNPTFNQLVNLAVPPAPITLPVAVSFVALFAFSSYGLFSGIKKLRVDPNEKRQEVYDIIRKYSNEIVISADAPVLSRYSVLRVSCFEELLKLAVNLNKHIMCYHDDEHAEFALIVGSYAYFYSVGIGDGDVEDMVMETGKEGEIEKEIEIDKEIEKDIEIEKVEREER